MAHKPVALDIVDLTASSPSPPPLPTSIPSINTPTIPPTRTSRSTQLQVYIATHWASLTSADRKRGKKIIQRGNPSASGAADLSQLPSPSLEELYHLVYQATHPGQDGRVENKIGNAEEKHIIFPSARSTFVTRAPQQTPASTEGQWPKRPGGTLPIPRPEQVQSLIMSCDANALRAVFLELCKSSPALSRAAVRCLAPHSSFAQSTLRKGPPAAVPAVQQRVTRPFRTVPGPSIKLASENSTSSLSPIPKQTFRSDSNPLKRERAASPSLSPSPSWPPFSQRPTPFHRSPVKQTTSAVSNPAKRQCATFPSYSAPSSSWRPPLTPLLDVGNKLPN